MSIAVLNQVYVEARRMAVAGSVVAKGDFRLKKLLPPLEQAGTKAAVFTKIAECAKLVIDGPEDDSAENLLELTSLVSAVLYTQGETGLAGDLHAIESVNLGGETAQTSARLLKPLLEALNSTGSGRLELVKDAHARGAFRDLRLVRPAIHGLDDPYPEIAEFLADKVLPIYGKAILPELRKLYDPKGTKGHPRRLKLMHALDPAGTRELVKQALEGGSKEVKVAAISCLGADPEDLQFLIEEAGAKAQDVRSAAFEALALIDDPAAVAKIAMALDGKDLDLAIRAIRQSKVDRLTSLLIAEIHKSVAGLPKLKEKKKVSEAAGRLSQLIGALPKQGHPGADELTCDLFDRRSELATFKGDTHSGSDVVEAVIARMAHGPRALQQVLARTNSDLSAEHLAAAFEAARASLPAAEVYDRFAHYLSAADGKKKGKSAEAGTRAAVIAALGGDYVAWYRREQGGPLDPRWLDLAVQNKHLGLINAVGVPGHPGAEAFLEAEFAAAFAKAKNQDALRDLVGVMVHQRHPKAVDALLASFEKVMGKPNMYWWHIALIGMLPKTAVPRLEAVVSRLKDREADRFVEAVQAVRDKPD